MEATRWPAIFDDFIDFRRFLYRQFGLPVRAEVKANHLIRNSGVFRRLRLGEPYRARLFRLMMRVQPKLGLQTFAIVVNKAEARKRMPDADAPGIAWTYLLQRLERFSTDPHHVVLILHDEGDGGRIRKLARRSRRAGGAPSQFGTGYLQRPFVGLLDDPVPRNSAQSYFIQLADLNAYAAYRAIFPPPATQSTPIVPQASWGNLGSARLAAVSRKGNAPTGIVLYP